MSDCRQCEWANGYKSLAIQDGSASMALAEHIRAEHTEPTVGHPSEQALRDAWLAGATYGMCTACGAIEVALLAAAGTRDYSAIGESAEYPTGYGCEMCS